MPGRDSRLGALLIAAAVLLVYLPALGGGYLSDDQSYVVDNVALQSTAGIVDLWKIPPATKQYYPLTFTSFWVEYRLWGDAPFGYHLINVALHAVDALLLWRLLALLGVPGAFAAAWIFAVHPVHVESVAWIAERKNVLCGLFALLATISWTRFLDDGRRSRVLAAGLWFLLALLSKTQVCALPLVLLLLTWWRQPRRLRESAAPLAALAAVSAAAVLVTISSEAAVGESLLDLPSLDATGRVLVAARALWFYAAKLAWPADLRANYGAWAIDPASAAQLLVPMTALAVAVALWSLRGRLGKGPFTAAASFFLLLAPTLGFVDFNFMRYAFVADHFQYLASMPLIALFVAAAARASERAPARIAAALRNSGVAVAVLVLALLSWQRAGVFRDEVSLWRDNVERDPRCATAHNHLGLALVSNGRLDDAIASFRTALRLDPGLADAHHNWGLALQRQGKFDEAIAQYEQGLALRPASRTLRNSIGVILQTRGDVDAAIPYFAEALRLDPTYAQAHNNWGAALFRRGDAAGAVDHFREAARLDPTYADAQDNWGVALLSLGQAEEALLHLQAASALAPKRVAIHRHWGDALTRLGRHDEAAAQYRAAGAR